MYQHSCRSYEFADQVFMLHFQFLFASYTFAAGDFLTLIAMDSQNENKSLCCPYLHSPTKPNSRSIYIMRLRNLVSYKKPN